MLLDRCICGRAVNDNMEKKVINEIPCRVCDHCGLIHQEVNLTEEQYYNFYSEKYHTDYQSELGQIDYQKRYEHDCSVARMRMNKYKHFLKGTRILDIGAANGAFVDVAREQDWDAWGVEPSADICNTDTTYPGTIWDQCFLDGEFDNVTMHDVLEHLIDPIAELDEIHRVLSYEGLLVLDMPNFFVDEGVHHWRPVEHLWMFDAKILSDVLVKQGFRVVGTDVPIPSKYVIYAEKEG